jgi:hypothetical protein
MSFVRIIHDTESRDYRYDMHASRRQSDDIYDNYRS